MKIKKRTQTPPRQMIGISLQITFLKRLHYMFALYFIKSFNEEEKLFVKHIKSRNNLHIYLTFVIIFREKKKENPTLFSETKP